ncbi:MAG: hypothetical protein KatS3mg011_1852 [Acidimicrobiia bacterium]|nr:MAG: hypothetical protein KatS3mg011_1852 [Acidimicrobiia bacterium]
MDTRSLLRLLRLVLILVGVGLAAIPLLALFDLARGGTGLGLCPDGLADCDAGFEAAPRLTVLLVVGLLVVLAGLRLVWLADRRLRRRRLPPGGEPD